MGTRNLTIVVLNGQYRIAQYCQWDGYPSGQGAEVLDFLENKMDREKFETALKQTKWITEAELRKLYDDVGADGSGLINMDQAATFKNRQPQLDRDMGAKVLEFVQESTDPVLLNDEHEFAKDGLFCEYAYVIDLDNNKLEVYGGDRKGPAPAGSRFGTDINDNGYGAIHPAKTYSLNDLPTQEQFEKDLSEDPDALDEDSVSYALHTLRQRVEPLEDTEIVNHIANYIEANMDDFLEAVNADD